jgi:hypothetical protein
MLSHRLPRICRRGRISKFAAAAVATASIGAGAIGTATASAQSRLPTTVANFCSFSGALGRPALGRVSGHDYAAWALGTRYDNYLAFDLNGDTHVDVVVYAPITGERQTIQYFGVCTGPHRDVWYNAAAVEAQLARQQRIDQQRAQEGSNEYWSEVGPQMEFNMDMEALIDSDM